MKELELLQQKIEILIKRYAALQADAADLLKKNNSQSVVIANMEKEIEQLQLSLQLNSVAQTASLLQDDTEKAKLKQHLDQVIKAIDKNIELL